MNEATDTMTVKMKAHDEHEPAGRPAIPDQQRRHHYHFGGVEAAEEAGIERRDGPRLARLDQHRREKQAGAYYQHDDDHHREKAQDRGKWRVVGCRHGRKSQR